MYSHDANVYNRRSRSVTGKVCSVQFMSAENKPIVGRFAYIL